MKRLPWLLVLVLGCAASASDPVAPRERIAALRGDQAARSGEALAVAQSLLPGHPLAVAHAVTDGTGVTHVRLAQQVDGVPVRHRDLHALVDEDGKVRLVGEPDALDGLDVHPGLDEKEAIELARQALEATGRTVVSAHATLMLDPELVKHPPPPREDRPFRMAPVERFVLRWIVVARVRDDGPGEAPWGLTVDARTGEVRDEGSGRHAFYPQTVHGTFATHYSGNRTLFDEETAADQYALVDALGDTFWRCDLDVDQHCYDVLQFTRPSVNDWGDGRYPVAGEMAPLDLETQGADAYAGAFITLTMLDNVYGYLGWDGNEGQFRIVTNSPDSDSYWADGNIYLGYGNWVSPPTPKTPLVTEGTPDVVGHEIGHGVFQSQAGESTGPGEAGGLDEGTGDILGALAGFYADPLWAQPSCTLSGCARLPISAVGAARWVLAAQEGYALRSLRDPNYPYATPAARTAEEHDAAGPVDRMFYFLATGVLPSTATLPGPDADVLKPGRKSACLTRGMTGLGLEKAGRIWLSALPHMQSSITFDYARRSALQAVVDLDPGHLLYSSDYKAVEDAFAAVEIGQPADRDPPKITFSALQVSTTQLTLNVDTAPADGPPPRELSCTPDPSTSDPNGISDASVSVGSIVARCIGHCEINVDPHQLPNGTSVAVVQATDKRNNTAKRSFFVSVDLTPPTISAFSETSPTPGNARTFHLAASDASGLRSVTLVTGSASSTTTLTGASVSETVPLDVTSLPHGSYLVTARVQDKYGNEAVSHLPIFVDHHAPEQCQVSGSSWNGTLLIAEVDSSDADTGVASVELFDGSTSVAARTFSPSQKTGADMAYYSAQPVGLGLHHLTANCVDLAGNVAHGALDLTVSKPPVISVNASAPTAGHVVVSAQLSDPDGLAESYIYLYCPDGNNLDLATNTYGTHPTSTVVTGDATVSYVGICTVRVGASDRYRSFALVDVPVNLQSACGQSFAAQGGNAGGDYVIDVGAKSGHVTFDYDTYDVADRLIVSCADGGTVNQAQTYTTTCVATGDQTSATMPFACASSRLRVHVVPNCDNGIDTNWKFTLHCAAP